MGWGKLYRFLGGMGLNKELVKQLYCNGLNAREIAEQLKNRNHLKFYENEVRKITKYESKQYMSDKTFILKNRSLYETKEDGDIVLKKDIGYSIPWDVPRRLTNEFKSC